MVTSLFGISTLSSNCFRTIGAAMFRPSIRGGAAVSDKGILRALSTYHYYC